jgi:hypothetical protein
VFLLPRNHPGLAASLIELLRSHGSHPEQQLQALLIPPNLDDGGDPADTGRTWSGVLSFENTVKALLDTEILERAGRQLQLTAGFADHLGTAAVPDRLAGWLLDEHRTGADPSGSEHDRGASGDLAHALTWFLELDPLGPWATVSRTNPEVSPVARLHRETGRSLPANTLDNPSDWSLFVRWSVFLGFAELRPDRRVDPDPTVALVRVLDEALPDEMSLSTFLDRLGSHLPMFGGHLERSWHGRPTPSSQGTVRPSLANALLRLEEQGRLTLDPGVDEDDVVVLEFGRFEPVRGPEGTITPSRRRYARIKPEVAD